MQVGVASPTGKTPTPTHNSKFVPFKTGSLVFTCEEKENANAVGAGGSSVLIMKSKQRGVVKKKGETPTFKHSAQRHVENYKSCRFSGQQQETAGHSQNLGSVLGEKCLNKQVKVNNLVSAEEH